MLSPAHFLLVLKIFKKKNFTLTEQFDIYHQQMDMNLKTSNFLLQGLQTAALHLQVRVGRQ